MKQNNAAPMKEEQAQSSATQLDSTFGSVFGTVEEGSQFQGDAQSSEFGAAFEASSSVSQVFSEENASGNKKRKIIYTVLGVLSFAACAYLGWQILMGGEEESAPITTLPPPPPPASSQQASEASQVSAPTSAQQESAVSSSEAAITLPQAPSEGITDSPTATAQQGTQQESLQAVATEVYAEDLNGPVIRNAQDGTIVEVSRSEDFSSLYITGKVKNGSFRIPEPPTGVIYWRTQGSNEVHKIEIKPREPLHVKANIPSQISAQNSLHWSSASHASYYRVEIATDKDFSNITTVIATKETHATLSDVGTGEYYIRIGGLNLKSGMWEFTRPQKVSIQ